MLTVNGKNVDFILDTGAEVSTITEQTLCELDIELEKPKKCLTGADGSNLNVLGTAAVRIKGNCRSTDSKIFVLKGSRRNLLGLPDLRKLNLLAVVNSLVSNMFDPMKIFPKVFEGLGTLPGSFRIHVKQGTEPKCIFAPRPIAAGYKVKAKLELDEMIKMGVIEPVEKPTDWCSALTIAPKSEGKIRMCVDLTSLNKSVKREIYPLPRISDMLSLLSTGTMFSKLDANSGFWQVKLDDKSKLLTTFVTPWGRFCFRRMPFGISSAPEFFQRAMEKILVGLDGVICLMDDILVYGKTASDHWDKLYKVMDRIEKSGMTLKKEKCEFGCTEIKFLGHLVSRDGIQPDPDKIKAIMKINPPNSKREARRFTGMVNYVSKFSDKIAGICRPIYAVSGTKSQWFWGADQQSAFDEVKRELSKAPILCVFDLNKKHRVSADASRNALGAVLLQLNNSNHWQPVEYASRKMTQAEEKYAMVEKEALAITWACEKFDYFLVGRDFEIETDHKALVSILGEKDLSCLPLRVQRFKLRLMRYGFEIFHTPGKDMFLADSLSRPNNSKYSDHDLQDCNEVETYVNYVVESAVYIDMREEAILSAMNSDTVSKQTLNFILKGWPPIRANLTGELAHLFVVRDNLSEYNGLLLYNSRIYIPKSLRDWYLNKCHEGHQGITKCRRRALKHFWWPGLSKDISEFVEKCNICVMNKEITHEPMVESILPSGPWEFVGSDIFVFKHELYVVMIDYYSKWIEALPVNSQTSGAVIKACEEIFSRLGVPKEMRSDNGRCYDSREFRHFAKDFGFVLKTSSPRYPQSNGLAESAVKTVKKLWGKCENQSRALMAYRTTPLKSGYSPSDLMFGRPIRSSLGIPHFCNVDLNDFEERESEKLLGIKRKWDRKYRVKQLPSLNPGEIVWVKAPTDKGSMGSVIRKDPLPNSYWVKVNDSEIRRNRKHLFQLFHESPRRVYYDNAPNNPPVEELRLANEPILNEPIPHEPPPQEHMVPDLEGGMDDNEIGEEGAPPRVEGEYDPILERQPDNEIEEVQTRPKQTRSGRTVKPPHQYEDTHYY